MPVDHKRINGPEATEPYHLYSKEHKNNLKEVYQKLYTQGKRLDSRKPEELRKIYMKTGVVTQAKGSAYIELQNTKVIVSVFDPREIPNKNEYNPNGELYCEFKYAPFSAKKRRSHQQDSEEKEYSVILRRSLESAVCRHEFPNFQVDIYALVLENDGSALGAAITCAGLALAHSGVPMYDLVTAVTLGRQGDRLFMDPTVDEEYVCNLNIPKEQDTDLKQIHEHGIVVVSVLSTHNQISELYQTGCFNLDTLTDCINKLMDANKLVVPLLQKSLVRFVTKHVKQKTIEERKIVEEQEIVGEKQIKNEN